MSRTYRKFNEINKKLLDEKYIKNNRLPDGMINDFNNELYNFEIIKPKTKKYFKKLKSKRNRQNIEIEIY